MNLEAARRLIPSGPLIVRSTKGYKLVIEKGWVSAANGENWFRTNASGLEAYIFVCFDASDIEQGGGQWRHMGDLCIYTNRGYKQALETASKINELVDTFNGIFNNDDFIESNRNMTALIEEISDDALIALKPKMREI